MRSTADIHPFEVLVPDSALDDLRDRLRRVRWPEPATVADWSQGVPLDHLQDVCRYWAHEYDWRRREAWINGHEQHRVVVDGLGIHVLHVCSPEPDALPLLVTHGWPGSIVEFTHVLGPLTDPAAHGGDRADAFHVVCPTIPGFGFSDKPAGTGWGVERIAAAWGRVMAALGYERYGAQGGDWGAVITHCIATAETEHCVGIHLNMVTSGAPRDDDADPTPLERAAKEAAEHYRRFEAGYSTEQSTRPQTIGYALVDSPVAQAAWILEKFHAWTDPRSELDLDDLLDNVMMYWLPAAGASSARLYWESFGRWRRDPVLVPTAVSIFPHELFLASERWARRTYANIHHWRELDRGGHFAALEQPDLFVEEVRAAFRPLR
jgi:epoxide hydrolase